MSAPPYAIGSDHLPGLSKLIEEIGEVGQVAGKIVGLGHMGEHWDGTNLNDRLEEELADVIAAARYFIRHNDLNATRIEMRIGEKLALFEKWHAENQS